jgi:hypothetical protein
MSTTPEELELIRKPSFATGKPRLSRVRLRKVVLFVLLAAAGVLWHVRSRRDKERNEPVEAQPAVETETPAHADDGNTTPELSVLSPGEYRNWMEWVEEHRHRESIHEWKRGEENVEKVTSKEEESAAVEVAGAAASAAAASPESASLTELGQVPLAERLERIRLLAGKRGNLNN